MRFYFAAVELGWRKEAKACADQLASRSLSDVLDIYVPEMESIRSVPYRNIIVYVDSRRRSGTSSAQLEWNQDLSGTWGKCYAINN